MALTSCSTHCHMQAVDLPLQCTGPCSLQTDPSLLSYEQALADFATLIFHLKDKYRAHASAVIGFGGSYGGMLAAWLRAKYPLALQVWPA